MAKRGVESGAANWMTIGEAAKFLAVSPGFLRKAVRARRIPFARVRDKQAR